MASSLSGLTSFGDVAAEDDAVLDYFLRTDAVARLEGNEVFLVVRFTNNVVVSADF